MQWTRYVSIASLSVQYADTHAPLGPDSSGRDHTTQTPLAQYWIPPSIKSQPKPIFKYSSNISYAMPNPPRSDWPDESVSDDTLATLSAQEAVDLYKTGIEMYRQAKLGTVSPDDMLADFEEFLSVVKNTRDELR